MPFQDRDKVIASVLLELEFSRILIVNQKQAELDRFGKLLPKGGYCYGYSEYWKLVLLTIDLDLVRQQFPTNLPLSDEVIFLQRKASCSVREDKMKNKPYVAAMIQLIVEKFLLGNQKPQTMLEIMLADRPRDRSYHDLRAYWDEHNHLHWFDANAGWFRSNNPNPSADSIAEFLTNIFRIIKYHFRCGMVYKRYTTPEPIVAKPKLTILFDTTSKIKPATPPLPSPKELDAEEPSSSDESEDEEQQLKRWVANMRVKC